MENSNYAESGDSSPRSRDIDCENPSWDEQPTNYRVKFMCSYGGKITPRPHDNQLTYIGGDTKILAVDRIIKFPDLMNKLQSFCDSEIVFKYQLPGEDLDALISVTNEEDLEHMMAEYDRVHRLSPKPPRLRLFLFQQKNRRNCESNEASESKPNPQWLADALDSSGAPNNQDLLFGFDKGGGEMPVVNINIAPPVVNIAPPVSKLPELEMQGGFPADLRSESAADDRSYGESVIPQAISPVEIQRQIHELQRMQIANQEQAMFRKNSDEALSRAFHGEYYVQKVPDNGIPVAAAPSTVSNAPPTYWQDMNGGGVGGGYTTTMAGSEHPVYLIPTPGGMYQTSPTGQQVTGPPPAGMYHPPNNVQPVTGQVSQVGQNYYTMQRVQQPDVYREQPAYSMGPPQPKIIARPGGVGGGMGVAAETGYTQVAYDNAGRQVYYTAAPGSVMAPSYATVVGNGVDLRQVAAPPMNVNPEVKVTTTAAV
ncbi:hypothetical protein ACHQM5_023120 [Ranunculus cassubicifolius]